MNKIKCIDAVMMLKQIGLSSQANQIAMYLKTDSRAVATALRGAVKDGRVTITYRRGIGNYRFVRLTPKLKH